MNTLRTRVFSALAAATFLLLSAYLETKVAQQPPAATTVRTVIALTTLRSVVDAPLFSS